MTGTLIILGLVALLVAALEATHRRTRRHWHPGSDLHNDRDAARTDDELRALVQADPVADPYRLAPPLSAETDARLVTRAAA